MNALFNLLPLAAAILAVPQFLPQVLLVRRTRGTAGVSWSWAVLTSVNNAAWVVYFGWSGFWTALIPAASATGLAGVLAVELSRCGAGLPRRPATVALIWTLLLVAFAAAFGRVGLGTALTATLLLQVAPSVWTAYRTTDTSGISASTWSLIFGELLCWGVFGIHAADLRLTVLGATGVIASLLMLGRLVATRRSRAHPRPRELNQGVSRPGANSSGASTA